MQPERDTGTFHGEEHLSMPNLEALDAELERRIERIVDRKIEEAFQRHLSWLKRDIHLHTGVRQ